MNNQSETKYEIEVHPVHSRVEVLKNGIKLASSTETLCLRESVYEPVYYFPKKDVNFEVLTASELVTFCPFKGNASYWSFEDRRSNARDPDICWAYLNSIAESKAIKNYYAFFPNKTTLTIDGKVKDFDHSPKNRPLINDSLASFTLLEAPNIKDFETFFSRLATVCSEADPQLQQITLSIRTLHPQLNGYAYLYKKDKEITKLTLDQSMLTNDSYLKSPLKPVLDGYGGVRCVLKDGQMIDAFPVLSEFKDQGITDYCALPIVFSDGQMNVISFATKNPSGFSTAFLGSLHQAVGGLTKVIESSVTKQNMNTFLQTYLGKLSSNSLLEGSTKRGDGKLIDCAFFFCDLRNSTQYISDMSKDEFLTILNRYFDAVAEPVLEHGGEIVHYLGDAVLGFFPKQEGQTDLEVCHSALRAASAALSNLHDSNEANSHKLNAGIALHYGECIYCNVGTKNRMDFSTIGPCVNKTVRVEGYTKMLDKAVLCTQSFFDALDLETRPFFENMGECQLRGFTEKESLYAPLRDKLKAFSQSKSRPKKSKKEILPL